MGQNITEVMMQIRGGAALDDAGKRLAEVVLAVKATGKKGSITLKIDIEPDKQDDTVVTFQPSLEVKVPRKPYAKGIFYVDERNGNVSREDPKQLELLAEQNAEKEAERERQRAEGIVRLDQVGRGNGTAG